MRKLAICYTALSVIAFFVVSMYNTWSSGNGFTGVVDDEFENKLVISWLILGAVGSFALWVATYVVEGMVNKEE